MICDRFENISKNALKLQNKVKVSWKKSFFFGKIFECF